MIGVNHIIGHVFSCFLENENGLDGIEYPFTGMVISGGHTSSLMVRSISDVSVIGRTVDDAVGEAFDKVGKVLGLGYPGGPAVERAAGNFSGSDKIVFPRALMQDPHNLDFSFSGIKTAVMYKWKDSEKNDAEIQRICYSFQEAVVDVICKKMLRAVSSVGSRTLAVGGGVVNNTALRTALKDVCSRNGIDLYLPLRKYCSDNAAMIGVLGERLFADGFRSDDLMNVELGEF
ncbi:MAG TPA: tRNA (adenosine(37)-N6)-threonylcarbamoyltransferase complex transferase subunit TsaD, partial [Candidatus Omnitrophota bacterium]|nr:tRNA (adenosine(37)-N6)-threonylcarbamoyltransferase complex transferase subunit TsaD [Candidatus Omnitrophota bacterium]